MPFRKTANVWEIRSAPLRYGLAFGSFALILVLSFGLERMSPIRFDFTSLIILLMIASAWYLGLGPGLVVAIGFEITLEYLSNSPPSSRNWIIIFNRLVLFFSVVLFASLRRGAEKRLRQQREWLQVTLASIGEAVIATDVSGIVSFINPTAEQLTGWSVLDGVGKKLDEVFKIFDEGTHASIGVPIADLIRESTPSPSLNRALLVTRDGREFAIENTVAPIRETTGEIIGMIVIFYDVSERRRAELEREHLLEREQSARKQAETSDRLKDEFLATVSHELRTPLSAILGWSSMLNLGVLTEQEVRSGLAVIERNARAQSEIISDILDVSRIITGKLSIHSVAVEFAPIIQAAIDTLQLAATAKHITLDVSLASDAGLVAGEPERLQQIIWNLVSNAIKFTPEHGHVAVSLKRINGQLEVTVRDNGIGISPEFLPHVFERFRQADSSTTRSHGGLGLGLSIVRHLVELHGGTVSAQSEGLGHGATFTVRLPAATQQQATSVEATFAATVLPHDENGTSKTDAPDLTGIRVLVVDDEQDSLEVLCLMLEQFGASVRPANSSQEALTAFRQWRPHVLVSDLQMPEVDGYELIRKIRALPAEEGGTVPAAALSAHVRMEDQSRALASGFQTHIPKPVDPETLVAAVNTLANGIKRQEGER